jgi:SAM-dependent methyltransferase
VVSSSIYPEAFFPPADRGPEDIVLTGAAVRKAALDDMLFGDLIAASHAARDPGVVERLRGLIERLRPDVVLLEHPWTWLPLREALKTLEQPAIVYSSANIEWRIRPGMYRLGLRRPDSDARVAATRALEAELWGCADVVMSISDVEGDDIARESGREVVYLPPTSDIAEADANGANRFATETRTTGVSYAGLLSSAYWPNLEGFFEMFPNGLGFLRSDEQIWVGGSLGAALVADPRYQDFQTLNDTRMCPMGYVADVEKAAFLNAARCVIVPVRLGGGAKLKTADALASGRPVISTSEGIEGYGPLVSSALGHGVYVADNPETFRALTLRALREGLPGCDDSVRAALRQQRLTDTIGPLFDRLLETGRSAPKPVEQSTASSPDVEWQVDQSTAATLMAHISQTWTRLGQEKPHWSVLTHDRYAPEKIDQTRDAFFESGAEDRDMLVAAMDRFGFEPAGFARAFEFGCGVGRVTPFLARTFSQVTACDVSTSHIAIAQEILKGGKIWNATLRVANVRDFGMVDEFDVWFSRLVLQHNPPPVIAMVLHRALSLLAPGGIAYFQVPTHASSYRFRIADYMRRLRDPDGPAGDMEMHLLPKPVILEIAEQYGCEVLDIGQDGSTGMSDWESSVVILRKRS